MLVFVLVMGTKAFAQDEPDPCDCDPETETNICGSDCTAGPAVCCELKAEVPITNPIGITTLLVLGVGLAAFSFFKSPEKTA